MLTSHKTTFTLWDHLIGTFTNATYYLHVSEFTVWTSLKVYLVGMLIVSLFFSLRLITQDIPRWLTIFDQGLTQARTHYPPTWKFEWDGSHLTTNAPQPLQVPYPKNWSTSYTPEKFLSFEAAELSETDIQQESYAKYFLVITPTQAYLQNAYGQWSHLSLIEVPGFDHSFVVTNETKDSFISTISQTVKNMQFSLSLLVILVSPLLMCVTTFLQGILDIFLLYLLLRLYRFPMTLKKVFQLCLHIWVVAQFVAQVSFLLNPHLSWSLFSITFWIVVAYLLFSWNQSVMKLISGQ